MRKTTQWNDYELLDTGDGVKIERFNDIITQRPEPTATWRRHNPGLKADAVYTKTWDIKPETPTETIINYRDMSFQIRIEAGKQVGLFPEQAVNWDWMRKVLKQRKQPVRILNLFAYTGGATIACAMENIEEIVHIDALKSANNSAKENILLNHLEGKQIRIIQEDALKFLLREKKRGRTYHGIIMDPPSFGRGPKKEQWKIEDHLPQLMEAAIDILDKNALFLSVNTYTSNLPSNQVLTIMNKALSKHGFKPTTDSGPIGITIQSSKQALASGLTTRWCAHADLLRG